MSASEEAEGARSEWRVVAASVCGISHERQGTECQDAHHWAQPLVGVVAAAVADGAGSASHGRLGAETSARAGIEALVRRLREAGDMPGPGEWRGHLEAALQSARTAVLELAIVEDLPPRELASTLILIAATRGLAAAAQIGDGAALVRSSKGEVLALTRPPTDEYINQTTFIVSDDALETAQIQVWRGEVGQVAAITDGLQRLALRMPEGEPHAPFFAPLFRFIADATDLEESQRLLEEFLRSPRITERTDDDLTLLLAAPPGL